MYALLIEWEVRTVGYCMPGHVWAEKNKTFAKAETEI